MHPGWGRKRENLIGLAIILGAIAVFAATQARYIDAYFDRFGGPTRAERQEMFFSRPSRYLRLLRGAPSGSQRYFVNLAGIVVDDHPRRPIHSAPIPITITSATLARVARIDALVSGDTHLLALRDRLPVMSPREFLDSLANR